MMRKHHVTSMIIIIILQNMSKKQYKLKKKNIPKRAKIDISQIGIVN